jgi:hypothetical protein
MSYLYSKLPETGVPLLIGTGGGSEVGERIAAAGRHDPLEQRDGESHGREAVLRSAHLAPARASASSALSNDLQFAVKVRDFV